MTARIKSLIQKNLQEIKQIVQGQEAIAAKTKWIDEATDYFILVLSFITTTLLTLKKGDDKDIITAVTVLGAVTTFVGSVKKMSGVKTSFSKAYSTSQHLRELYHDTMLNVSLNNKTPAEYLAILGNLNHELNKIRETTQLLDPALELHGDSLLNISNDEQTSDSDRTGRTSGTSGTRSSSKNVAVAVSETPLQFRYEESEQVSSHTASRGR
jgi:hypothetical protein